ncbi:MAG: site-specific integrase, partial [Nocardioidaceae bacterium]|nr:site-specific integrase [Nocardioidaceae bacterium]
MTAVADAVRTFLDHLAVERGLARNTVTSYRRDLLRYVEHLAEQAVTDIGDVGEEHVAGFLVRLRGGDTDHEPLSASSAARAVVAVRGLHRFCLREGVAPTDVAST